ncbi:hypothetical protein Taro_042176 [Colocasia esculenta]|uniref:Uncharacterized protein n=1 Tax=Colocasia esculenta TaxID=4460 RepID=A0A843WXV7_COLES|nr:hypothetical protein [Colocasia esculenta]
MRVAMGQEQNATMACEDRDGTVRSGSEIATGASSRSEREGYTVATRPLNATYRAIVFTGSAPESDRERTSSWIAVSGSMQSEVEEDHVFPSRSPLLQRPKLAAHDPNLSAITPAGLPHSRSNRLACTASPPSRRPAQASSRRFQQFLLLDLVHFDEQVVVYTPGPDGIAGSDKIREGCSLGLLQLDLAIARTPSYDIHQQSGTLSLSNFVENFDFEFDIDFVVLAQFDIESP